MKITKEMNGLEGKTRSKAIVKITNKNVCAPALIIDVLRTEFPSLLEINRYEARINLTTIKIPITTWLNIYKPCTTYPPLYLHLTLLTTAEQLGGLFGTKNVAGCEVHCLCLLWASLKHSPPRTEYRVLIRIVSLSFLLVYNAALMGGAIRSSPRLFVGETSYDFHALGSN